MSAHHYFRDFGYCDSGMIPWLLLAEMISTQGKSLAELVDARIEAYPVSGEINNEVEDPAALIAKIRVHYEELPHQIDRTDGLGDELRLSIWRRKLIRYYLSGVLFSQFK